MNTQNSLHIIITRDYSRKGYTHGHLTIDGVRVCSTLENANALVPKGQYPFSLIKCKQYSRKMPVLNANCPCDRCPKLRLVSTNSTLPCFCPMLKPGNGIHGRLDGSILVGKYNCLNSLIHPKDIFDPLYERIRKSVSRGNQVTLTIVDG